MHIELSAVIPAAWDGNDFVEIGRITTDTDSLITVEAICQWHYLPAGFSARRCVGVFTRSLVENIDTLSRANGDCLIVDNEEIREEGLACVFDIRDDDANKQIVVLAKPCGPMGVDTPASADCRVSFCEL